MLSFSCSAVTDFNQLTVFTVYLEVTFLCSLRLFSSDCFVFLASTSHIALTFSVICIFFFSSSHFFHYRILSTLRRLLMHSKCHNVTNPVTQNDCLVPNALYRIYALWDVVLMSESVCFVWTNKHHLDWDRVLAPNVTLVACLCLDEVFRWRVEIMNWLICRGRFRRGQRRGNGSELSIWDYPDLMEGIKKSVGGNPLSIRADFSHTDVWCCGAGNSQESRGGVHTSPVGGSILSFDWFFFFMSIYLQKHYK